MITASSRDLTFFFIPTILGSFDPAPDAYKHWIGWKPDFIVVTIINPEEIGGTYIIENPQSSRAQHDPL